MGASMVAFILRPEPGYWFIDKPDALAAYLDARPEWHRWDVARNDKRAKTELYRWYHKPAGARYVPASGIAIDKGRDGTGWVRFLGEDDRARRILAELATPATPEPLDTNAQLIEQLALFEVAV